MEFIALSEMTDTGSSPLFVNPAHVTAFYPCDVAKYQEIGVNSYVAIVGTLVNKRVQETIEEIKRLIDGE